MLLARPALGPLDGPLPAGVERLALVGGQAGLEALVDAPVGGQFVLADGKSLYYYQPEQGQVIKSPLKNAFRSETPLSFLLGIGNLKKDFKVSLKNLEQGNYVLQLGPKGELGGVGEIVLGIDSDTFNIVWTRIRDAAGNVTTIRFSNMRRGIGLKDSFFRPQVPAGVDVVELGS